MIILDGTVVTVALPAIQRDLALTQTDLSWVVSAYLIPFGGLLLLAGRLGDLAGRRRIFLIGVTGFTAASALCGAATTPALLIAARFLQGAAGAVASAVILGMVIGLFLDDRERATAIGRYSFVGAAGAAIGLLAGGVLSQTLGWHWVFLINVPIGVLTVVAARRLVPPDGGADNARGRDVSGAVLITIGLMLAVYTITEIPSRGWQSASTVGFGAISVLLLLAFVVRERRASDPLLPMTILKDRRVWVANLVQFLVVGALFTFQFLLALYLQLVLGYGAAATGLAFLPITVAIGVCSLFLAPRALLRWGGRPVLVTGVTMIGVGLAVLARVPVDGRYLLDVLPATTLMGAGGGLVLPSIATLGMSAATDRTSGVASGLLNTTQQVGGALGLAALTSLAVARSGVAVAAADAPSTALAVGYRLALLGGVAMVLAALGVTLVALRTQADPTAG